jgi:hypothetical protein
VIVEVQRAPFSRPAIHTLRVGPLSPFTMPTIKDHTNAGIVGEGPLQTCVDQLIAARHDIEKPWHSLSLWAERSRREGIICAHLEVVKAIDQCSRPGDLGPLRLSVVTERDAALAD